MQRQKHTARLRATIEEQTILKGTGVGDAIGRDDQTHETRFWDFGDRWSRSLLKASDRPCGFRVHGWEGKKLRSRPLQTGPRRTCQRAPSPRRVFGAPCAAGGKRHHVRVDCPCWSCSCGSWRFFFCISKAPVWLCTSWFFFFSPRTRAPTGSLRMLRLASSVPERSMPGSPPRADRESFSREGFATKNGDYDETVTSDGAVCPVVGRLLKRQADHMLKSKETTPKCRGRAPLKLSSQRLSERFPRGVRTPGVGQRHHDDLPSAPWIRLGTRTTLVVTLRGFWAEFGQLAYLPQARQNATAGPENGPSHPAVRCKCTGQP